MKNWFHLFWRGGEEHRERERVSRRAKKKSKGQKQNTSNDSSKEVNQYEEQRRELMFEPGRPATVNICLSLYQNLEVRTGPGPLSWTYFRG